MKKQLWWIGGLLALVLFIGGAYFLYQAYSQDYRPGNLAAHSSASQSAQESSGTTGSEAKSHSSEPEETVLAPDFQVEDGDGGSVSLSDFFGKPIVVNFWASWCTPCKSEMPEFEAAFAEYGDDIHFLMVNLTDGDWETMDSARAYIEEAGYTFPVYFDTHGNAAMTYGTSSIPATYFIDEKGAPAAYAIGALDAQSLQRGIDMVLEAGK